ncbi:MAG: hypothetical protein EHM30_14995, partial [Desulfobacteraceae bacterium]
ICSDGLSDMAKPEEIMNIVKTNAPSEAGRMLVDLANERGGNDNITIIVLKISESSVSQQAAVNPDENIAKERESVLPFVVEYDTDDFSGRALVNNISIAGFFIETGEIFSIGQKLSLTISDGKGENSVMAEAKVTERKARGIEVKYINLTETQKNRIQLFSGKIR